MRNDAARRRQVTRGGDFGQRPLPRVPRQGPPRPETYPSLK